MACFFAAVIFVTRLLDRGVTPMNRLLLLAACVWPAVVAAQPPAAVPNAKADLERGRQLATQVCAACHGADGNSTGSANPNIAGQHADYIIGQLAHYKAGLRQNPIMQGIVAGMTADDMRAVAVYYSQQKPKGLAARDASLAKLGQALWRGGDAATGVPACSACHGPTGAGIPKNYPRVAGQYADYTYAQLKAFGAGQRGADKEGKDTNGRIMYAIARQMSEAQMRAVAEYAAGLR
jgi:cytochrome c553